MAEQVTGDVTTAGRYDWSLQVTLGSSTYTASGSTFVVNEEQSPLGAGWTLSSVNQLVSIGADSVSGAPAGELMLYGTGGSHFFADGASTATFTSPANDNGTLTFNGST